ncbi:hypothetical protein BDF20DRAFT_990600 [Mycotypha africana]|uniref:uncharacterized protein n=1 Tax=Mycotypha africana TaxID=64632 RepID=UPI002300FF48|nr:uncharacterized protein BDF20DRAFT_990600 [Mycotypha africana]KAI8970329.1 hypothetical protein BDF20DRAFT_990600 [Mycotypha africana]
MCCHTREELYKQKIANVAFVKGKKAYFERQIFEGKSANILSTLMIYPKLLINGIKLSYVVCSKFSVIFSRRPRKKDTCWVRFVDEKNWKPLEKFYRNFFAILSSVYYCRNTERFIQFLRQRKKMEQLLDILLRLLSSKYSRRELSLNSLPFSSGPRNIVIVRPFHEDLSCSRHRRTMTAHLHSFAILLHEETWSSFVK